MYDTCLICSTDAKPAAAPYHYSTFSSIEKANTLYLLPDIARSHWLHPYLSYDTQTFSINRTGSEKILLITNDIMIQIQQYFSLNNYITLHNITLYDGGSRPTLFTLSLLGAYPFAPIVKVHCVNSAFR